MKTPEITIADRVSRYGTRQPAATLTWTGLAAPRTEAARVEARAMRADLLRLAARIEEQSDAEGWTVEIGDVCSLGAMDRAARGGFAARAVIVIELSSGSADEAARADTVLHDVIPPHLIR